MMGLSEDVQHALAASFFMVGLVVLGFIAMSECACMPASQGARETAAESTYLAEHLRCVDQFATRAEIDTCREGVRRRWAVKDAGGDQ